MGDIDQDGDIDIYTNNGGPENRPGDQLQENFLWKGADNGTNWTALQLTGVTSNRTAVPWTRSGRSPTVRVTVRTTTRWTRLPRSRSGFDCRPLVRRQCCDDGGGEVQATGPPSGPDRA